MNIKQDPQNYKNYFSYLYANARNTTFAQRIRHVYLFINKYILAGRIFRYLKLILFWLQTGTYFVVFSTALVFILPILLMTFLFFCVYRNIMHKKYDSYFRTVLKNQSVCIIFNKSEKYINENHSNFSSTIYVITNPFTPLKSCVKKIGKNTFIISMSYFFSLKNNVLCKCNPNVIYQKEVV